MAVQYEKQNRTAFEPESEKEQKTKTSGKEKNRSYYLRMIAYVLAVTILGYGLRGAIKYNRFFLQDNPAENYLDLDEFALIDSDSGEAVSNVRGLSYDDQYVSYWDEKRIETSRGITIGSSWEDVVEAYGDIVCRNIYYYDYSDFFDGDYSTDTHTYINEPITVSEFNEKYVKTGLCDPARNYITLSFEAELIGNQIVYTDAQYYDVFEDVYSSPWYSVMGNSPRRGWYDLNIDVAPPGVIPQLPDGGVANLSSSYY